MLEPGSPALLAPRQGEAGSHPSTAPERGGSTGLHQELGFGSRRVPRSRHAALPRGESALAPGISSQRGSPWRRAACCCRSFSTDQTDGRGAACCQVGPAARAARGGSSPGQRALGRALPMLPCPTAGLASPCRPCPLCPCPAACQPSPSPAAGRLCPAVPGCALLCPAVPCCRVWAPGDLSLWQLGLPQGRHGPRCSGRLISLWFWLLRLESSWGVGGGAGPGHRSAAT